MNLFIEIHSVPELVALLKIVRGESLDEKQLAELRAAVGTQSIVGHVLQASLDSQKK